MARIRQLPPHIVNKIAAGEVIERPASVVKELVENALDAGATRIDVTVEDGGATRIRVQDDGHGIAREDLALAFESHATSKLRDADDLFHIATMGFRGEALASIGSISKTTVRTRDPEEETGYELVHETGSDGDVKVAAVNRGTTIDVQNLFMNVPVRRRFLKSPSVELGHVTDVMTRFSLAYPEIGFSLMHGTRRVLELDAASDVRERIGALYGEPLAKELIRVDAIAGTTRLTGYIAPPHHDRPRQDRIFVFLNGRNIKDRTLVHAIHEGYRGLLMTRRHPTVFLAIEIDPQEVDVNVHPTKIEVRFRDSKPLHQLVRRTLRDALQSADLAPRVTAPPSDLAKRSPDTASRTDVRDAIRDYLGSAGFGKGRSDGPSVEATPSPARDDGAVESPARSARPIVAHEAVAAPEPKVEADRDIPSEPRRIPQVEREREPTPSVRESAVAEPAAEFGDSEAGRELLRPVQLHQTYILRETDDGFALTDQHALHERILYHRIHDRVRAGTVISQRLLIPERLDLAPGETERLLAHQDELRRIGFDIERSGERGLEVRAIPDVLRKLPTRALLDQVVSWIARDDEDEGGEKDFIDAFIEMAACKAAIKAGDPLEVEQMKDLLRQGDELPTSSSCPHGRPTTVRFTLEDLEKWFRRIV